MSDMGPMDFKELFQCELKEIEARRGRACPTATDKCANKLDDSKTHDSLIGLALSGGGIRSATFCLGLLQGLNDHTLLPIFDYLSTVSGGGFIGAWWSAWLSRDRTKQDLFPPPEQNELSRHKEYLTRQRAGALREGALYAEKDPVHHLRLFSNYLIPRKGAFSSDTWRAVAFFSRNLVLTWLVLLPLLLCAILGSRIYFLWEPHVNVSAKDSPQVARIFPYGFRTANQLEQISYVLEGIDRDQEKNSALGYKPSDRTSQLLWLQGQELRQLYIRTAKARLQFAMLPLYLISGWIAVVVICWMLAMRQRPRLADQWLVLGGFLVVVALGACIFLFFMGDQPPAHYEPRGSDRFLRGLGLYGWIGGGLSIVLIAWLKPFYLCFVNQVPPGVMKAEWRNNWRRNWCTAVTGSLLLLLVLIAFILIIGGFGWELIHFVWAANVHPWLKVGGWATIASALSGAIFTGIKASPSSSVDRNRKPPSLLTRIVVRVSPPLVLLLLAIGASDIALHLIKFAEPPPAGLGRLQWLTVGAFLSIFFCMVLAGSEMSWHRTHQGSDPMGSWLAFYLLAVGLLVWIIIWLRYSLDYWHPSLGFASMIPLCVLVVYAVAFTAWRMWDALRVRAVEREPNKRRILIGWIVAASILGACCLTSVGSLFAFRGTRDLHSAAIVFLLGQPLATLSICIILVTFEMSYGKGRNRRALLLIASAVAFTSALVVILLYSSGGHAHWTLRAQCTYATVNMMAVSFTWVIALGWTADPNRLTLHAFYKERIIRAYLGASNPLRHRREVEITDVADGDDLLLSSLSNTDKGAPYHLVNATLNLVGAQDLVTAQRSAASFIMSKIACGSMRTGYRKNAEEADQGDPLHRRLQTVANGFAGIINEGRKWICGVQRNSHLTADTGMPSKSLRMHAYMAGQLTLGTAVAISGAAVSPNMGSESPTAAVASLLALLNLRLGFWIPNPLQFRWTTAQARLWPFYTLRELLSNTNDLSSYCYLTDGGHFDNTGVYSLLERGCRLIVVADCGADPAYQLVDLGNAIRRCRIDFGAKFDIPIKSFIPSNDGRLTSRLAIGRFEHSERYLTALRTSHQSSPSQGPTKKRGVIIWIKPGIIGDESSDVLQYFREHPTFPQQSTVNQFFNEAQFESYRQLGRCAANDVAQEAGLTRDLLFEANLEKYINSVWDDLDRRGSVLA